MDCPNCGYARPMFAKECPRCVHIANTLRDEALVRPVPSQFGATTGTLKRAFCSSCGQVIEVGIRFCKNCGASQFLRSPAPPPLTRPEMCLLPQPAYDTPPSPNITLISIMWVVTVIQIVLVLTAGLKPPLPLLLDLPSFIIALILVSSQNGTDRGNGRAQLVLDGIRFLMSVMAAAVQLNS